MTQQAAAHIITAEATGLGDPEIIIMTRDEGMGAEEIERVPFGGHDWQAFEALGGRNWRVVGDYTEAGKGYWVVDVEKSSH